MHLVIAPVFRDTKEGGGGERSRLLPSSCFTYQRKEKKEERASRIAHFAFGTGAADGHERTKGKGKKRKGPRESPARGEEKGEKKKDRTRFNFSSLPCPHEEKGRRKEKKKREGEAHPQISFFFKTACPRTRKGGEVRA